MKKGFFITIIVVAIVAIGISGYVLLNKDNKIMIKFNTNSENTLSSVEIKKGESINLPSLERDGYEFLGWYIGEEKIDNNYKFDKLTYLNAKWEKKEVLNYELVVYCDDDYFCHDESFFDHQIIVSGRNPLNKDFFNKYVINTKSSSASYFNNISNYILYEDDGLRVYDLKEKEIIIKNLNINSDAKYLNTVSNFILYRDGNLKIYDILNKKVTNDKINVDSNLKEYQLYLNEDETRVNGIGYIKNEYMGYYNIDKNIKLYEGKYKLINRLSYDLKKVNDHAISITTNSSDAHLLSIDEEKELLADETHIGSENYKSYGKNGKYVYSIINSDNYFKVYSTDLKPMLEGYGINKNNYNRNHYINIGDYIYILDGNVVKKYDYDGKLLWTSKEYSEPIGLINRLERGTIFDKYKMLNNYIIYVKDDNLMIENVDNEKESNVITKLGNNRNIGLLSYYTKEEANETSKNRKTYEEGIYVSVTTEDSSGGIGAAKVTEYCYTAAKKIISYPPYTIYVSHEAKPIIYLYPEKEMDVIVKLGHIEDVTTIYPKYNDGWRVLAKPNGTLIDKSTGRSLYSLYWEGKNYPSSVTNEGFVIKGEDTASFLEEKLEILGLNEREAEEFIIYWLPQMEHNKYNYIKFTERSVIDKYMPLEITPKPDTLIRITMEFKPLTEKINVREQKLEKVERKGFTAVEWGGSMIGGKKVN